MRALLVKLTVGADAAEKANQALTVAATAVAGGAQVSLWLTGEATWLAVADSPTPFALEHAADPSDLVAAVAAGGSLTVCSQCALRRGIKPEDLVPGARIAGAAAYVEEALADGTQALVY